MDSCNLTSDPILVVTTLENASREIVLSNYILIIKGDASNKDQDLADRQNYFCNAINNIMPV